MHPISLIFCVAAGFACPLAAKALVISDICIYGGNSPASFTAAIQAAKQGRSVSLIAPEGHIGGFVIEGLSSSDIGDGHVDNRRFVGGLAREFYSRVAATYGHSQLPGAFAWEPKVAEQVILSWLAEYPEIQVYSGEQLPDDGTGVVKNGTKIQEIVMQSGRRFSADVFIDASIEGDLMKFSGVSYVTGREGNAVYGETMNGINTNTTYRQFTVNVDPYAIPGDATSGLIATVQPTALGTHGAADPHIMGYCFRLCLTNVAANRLSISQPTDYDPAQYEIYRRYFAAGGTNDFLTNGPKVNVPNGKTDMGSWHELSANLYGMNINYPDGSRTTREAIYKQHRSFVIGLIWFLQNDPAVPVVIRNKWALWGLPKDEFIDNGNWPRMVYVRSARRMVSDYVVTEQVARPGTSQVSDPISMAYWPLDMHHARRIVKNGKVWNEGFVLDNNVQPFGVSYRALVPKASECTNLIVAACPSASYVAYGAIRLIWGFMSLGHAAGSAAAYASTDDVTVQNVDYTKLRLNLLADGQILSDPNNSPNTSEVEVDDATASFMGTWTQSTFYTPYIGTGYRHDGSTGQGTKSARFVATLPHAGTWSVYGFWSAGTNRASNVTYGIEHADGTDTLSVNQRLNDRVWTMLGTYSFNAGSGAAVTINNAGADGYVMADAVKFVNQSSQPIVEVVAATGAVKENGGVGRYQVVAAQALDSPLTVFYQIGSNLSTGKHVSGAMSSVTLDAGTRSTPITFTSVGDAAIEGIETVTVSLLENSAYQIGNASSAQILVLDPPYDLWAEGQFTAIQRLDPLISGENANPDGDAWNNALERAFGGRAMENDPPGDLIGPTLHFDTVSSRFIYHFPRGPEARDLLMSVLVSDDLSIWNDAREIPGATVNETSVDTSVSLPMVHRSFLRTIVESPGNE